MKKPPDRTDRTGTEPPARLERAVRDSRDVEIIGREAIVARGPAGEHD